MRVAFSILCLAYGLLALVVACGLEIPIFQQAKPEQVFVVAFVIALILYAPFVITYTKLGLNSAEGELPSPETELRRAELRRICPIWHVAWRALIILVILTIVSSLLGFQLFNPFYAFVAGISLSSGIWFLVVYPKAALLFDPDKWLAPRTDEAHETE